MQFIIKRTFGANVSITEVLKNKEDDTDFIYKSVAVYESVESILFDIAYYKKKDEIVISDEPIECCKGVADYEQGQNVDSLSSYYYVTIEGFDEYNNIEFCNAYLNRMFNRIPEKIYINF